jgi:hypothetical protein
MSNTKQAVSSSKVPITEDEILAFTTENGGWTKDQLAEWGVPWPPPKGWKRHIIETGYPWEPDERKSA